MKPSLLTGFPFTPARSALMLGALVLGACDDNQPQVEIETVEYRCENGERLKFKYVIPDGELGLGVLTYHRSIVPMHQEPAASGVLYVADKGQPGYRWHTIGDEGILSKVSLGNGEEEVVLKDCRRAEVASETGP